MSNIQFVKDTIDIGAVLPIRSKVKHTTIRQPVGISFCS